MEFNWLSIITPHKQRITASDLGDFEAELGFILPADYKAFVLSVNGGRIHVEHDIFAPKLSCNIFVNCLLPLTDPSPSIGIHEWRSIQVASKLGLRQGMVIGDDMGTGFYYLILDGPERGSVYFGFKDDIPEREGDWYSKEVWIPDSMVNVSPTFNDLGREILRNKTTGEYPI